MWAPPIGDACWFWLFYWGASPLPSGIGAVTFETGPPGLPSDPQLLPFLALDRPSAQARRGATRMSPRAAPSERSAERICLQDYLRLKDRKAMRRARWIGISGRPRVTRYKVWRMVFGKRRRPNLLRTYRSTLCLWPRGMKCVAFPALDRPPPAQGAIAMSMRAAPYERARSRPLGSAERIHLQRHLRLMHRKEHRFTISKARRHAMRRERWIGISGRPRITR
jgi:hypothetical protein